MAKPEKCDVYFLLSLKIGSLGVLNSCQRGLGTVGGAGTFSGRGGVRDILGGVFVFVFCFVLFLDEK